MLEDKVFLDVNVMLDMLLRRDRYESVLQKLKGYTQCICSASVGIAYYEAQKKGASNQLFADFINDFEVFSVDAQTITEAIRLASSSNDLEDAIQIAACKQAGILTFVTADKKMAELYCDELNIELVE